MSGILVDSNILLDVFTEDPAWLAWSLNALAWAQDNGELLINPIVYAEVSVRFLTREELDDVLLQGRFGRAPIPFEAAFLAGKAYVQYRRRGGHRTSPLPDFFIGGHAATMNYRLLTRDPNRYRSYFPTIELIAP